MFKNFIISLKISLFTIFITGFFYPLLIMGISYVFFNGRAGGSFILDEKQNIVGSAIIGQTFKNPAYFFSRPSLAGQGYDGRSSGGANLAPTSKKLLESIRQRVKAIESLNKAPIPIDLVTSSASGLDPHISPEAAYWQAPSIALQRDVSLKRIISIIDDKIEHPQFNFLGNPRVNVLKLNLALDQFFGSPMEVK